MHSLDILHRRSLEQTAKELAVAYLDSDESSATEIVRALRADHAVGALSDSDVNTVFQFARSRERRDPGYRGERGDA